MEIRITIPNDKKDAIIDAFASQYGYQEEVRDKESFGMIPNPQSVGQFAIAQIHEFIKNVYIVNSVKNFNEGQHSVRKTAEAYMNTITVV